MVEWMSRGIRVGISERLLGECIQKNSELTQENEKLKEALRKCSPLFLGKDEELECLFCDEYYETGRHHHDCEYVRLTK